MLRTLGPQLELKTFLDPPNTLNYFLVRVLYSSFVVVTWNPTEGGCVSPKLYLEQIPTTTPPQVDCKLADDGGRASFEACQGLHLLNI